MHFFDDPMGCQDYFHPRIGIFAVFEGDGIPLLLSAERGEGKRHHHCRNGIESEPVGGQHGDNRVFIVYCSDQQINVAGV